MVEIKKYPGALDTVSDIETGYEIFKIETKSGPNIGMPIIQAHFVKHGPDPPGIDKQYAAEEPVQRKSMFHRG